MNEIPDGFNAETFAKEAQKANFLERAVNRKVYSLWQYLESLDEKPAQIFEPDTYSPSKKKKSRARIEPLAVAVLSAGTLAFVGVIAFQIYHFSHSLDQPKKITVTFPIATPNLDPRVQTGAGPEITRPSPLDSNSAKYEILAGQGSYVIYDYGVIINELPNTQIQAFPEKLNLLSRFLGADHPEKKIIITRIMPAQTQNDADMVKFNAFSRVDPNNEFYLHNFSLKYGVKSQQIEYVVIPWANIANTGIGTDLSVRGLSSELSFAWFNRVFASTFLSPDLDLKRVAIADDQKLMVGHELPLWIGRLGQAR